MQPTSLIRSPIFAGIIAFISAAVFLFFAIDALKAQYYEHNGEKSYFFEIKELPITNVENDRNRIIINANLLYSFTKNGVFEFELYKYKTNDKTPDGISVAIYADEAQIAQLSLNPYIEKGYSYIEDGLSDTTSIKFDIPKNAKRIAIEFSQNKNSDLDVVSFNKLKIHKANPIGCAVAAIALIVFMVSLCALIYFSIIRFRKYAAYQKIYDFFNDEKNALIIYRSIVMIFVLIVGYYIIISTGFTLNQEGRFHRLISLDQFFLYHAPRSDGRFFPLANTDYNLLWFLPYGFSPQGFYFINLVSFIIAICGVIYLLSQSDKDKIASRYINLFLLIMILLSLNRTIKAFMEIIYPERLLAVTIIIFMIAYKKAIDSDKPLWFLTAFFAALYATYQKEPMFGVFVVISIFSLLFMRKTKNGVSFNIALLINGGVFLAIYYFTTIKITGSFYGSDPFSASQYASFLAKTQIIVMLLIFSALRAWFLIIRKDREHLFYDAILFAACAFVCAYFILGFVNIPRSYYYYMPAAFMFAPPLAYWSKHLYFNKRYILFWTLMVTLLLSCRTFSLDSAISYRRNELNFAVSLSAYSRLDQRIIFVANEKRLSWQAENLIDMIEYADSKTYLLSDMPKTTNIEINSPDDPIDYDAIYIFEENKPIPRFKDFRAILKAKSSVSTFGAYVYDSE